MRLFILGATGGIGQHLLRIGLERGHELTAFVRSPQKITQKNERLKVVQGDLFSAEQMAESLQNHDAVLSAFGPLTLKQTTQRQEFGNALATALRKSGVRNVQLVSSAFLFQDVGIFGNILRSTIFRKLVPDMNCMEKEIIKDDIDWTIVRPPRLTDGSQTHNYRVAVGKLPPRGMTVSRADVAEFMIAEAEKHDHVHHVVGLAGP